MKEIEFCMICDTCSRCPLNKKCEFEFKAEEKDKQKDKEDKQSDRNT